MLVYPEPHDVDIHTLLLQDLDLLHVNPASLAV